MPGIFISHSTQDKPFVTKLAMDLIYRDIPVWFDRWELETGDSLIQKIFDSIDESSYLLIVLSSSSVKSKWVDKELRAALSKEEQINRRFIIPIRIEQCQVPLSIADRLYADFSASYLHALEQLTVSIKKLRLDEIEVPPQQQLVPVTFSKGIYLRESPFEKRITSILKTSGTHFRFSENQLVFSFDETYLKLRDRLIRRMENIEDDPFYTPDFERSFSARYEELISNEEKLTKGIILILNAIAASEYMDQYICVRACHWFARIIRTQLYASLYGCQMPGAKDSVESRPEWDLSPLGFNRSAASFFEVTSVISVDFGPGTMRTHVHLWVDEEWEMYKDWRELQQPLELKDYLTQSIIYKYIVPQMVNSHITPSPGPLLWDFGEYNVGPS